MVVYKTGVCANCKQIGLDSAAQRPSGHSDTRMLVFHYDYLMPATRTCVPARTPYAHPAREPSWITVSKSVLDVGAFQDDGALVTLLAS